MQKMALSIDHIKAPVAAEIDLFEEKFKQSMQSKTPLLDKITQYIVKRKGKQMRPLFVFLSAKMLGNVTESTYRAASLIELLHTATLVHDDVVDDANYRRGFFSINALWKNKIAVLVGDYLLSRGLLLSVEHKEFQLLQIVSNAVREMSEGELLQIEKARRLDIDETIYYDVIKKKTASLIASCCASGAASVNASEQTLEKMRLFGELVGMAFQIKDDLFDYGTDDIGKPVGNDIKEKKMTLPLIYALSQASWLEKQSIIGIIKKNKNQAESVRKVLDFVNQYNGIDYATKKMHELKNQALNLLNDVEQNSSKQALIDLVNFTVERKK